MIYTVNSCTMAELVDARSGSRV